MNTKLKPGVVAAAIVAVLACVSAIGYMVSSRGKPPKKASEYLVSPGFRNKLRDAYAQKYGSH